MSGGYTAIVIPLPDEDGVVNIQQVTVPEGEDRSMRFLQEVVGGWYGHLATEDDTLDFWFHDEGKLMGMPVNSVATEVLRRTYPVTEDQIWPGGPEEPLLVGPVVLTGNNQRTGETTHVRDGLWDWLQWQEWPGIASLGLGVTFTDRKGVA